MLDVFKRILATALGAMGLGALAAVPAAFAQDATPGSGNIPAPDLFDPQITCSMNLPPMNMRPMPSVVPDGADDSPLDMLIGMGDMELDTTTQGVMNLGFVINPMGSNCGAGTGTDAFNAADIDDNDDPSDGISNPGEGAIATDVAEGYSELITKFSALYGDPGDADDKGIKGRLDAAKKALTDARDDNQPQSELDRLQDVVDDRQEEYDDARAEVNAIGMGQGMSTLGPVYDAGVAEWMAKSAVTDAIEDYNSKVMAANTARTTVNAMSYTDYVPLRESTQIDAVFTGDDADTVSLTALRTYANLGDGSNAATQGDDGTFGGTGNFDAAGNLLVPLEDGDNDADTPLTRVTSSQTVATIKTRLDTTQQTVNLLKEARGNNQVSALDEVYAEAIRRAELELTHYTEQWEDTIGNEVDTRTVNQQDSTHADYVEDPITIMSRYGEYQEADNKRVGSEETLRQAVMDREAATEMVVEAFQSPRDFYDQLVARRKALKMQADAAVEKASEDGGTPTEAQTKLAERRAEGLTTAEGEQAKVNALLADAESPVPALIETLLETNGDDGQALADAIGANYATANSARTMAQSAVDTVNNLTGADGQVSQNTTAIADHETRISANEGEIWNADGTSRIDANEARSMQNEADIITTMGHVTENRDMITANREMVMMQQGMIDANTMGVMENRAMIDSNSMSIMRNMEDIQTLKSGVAASMALAGMPEMGARGVSVGAGSYGGETALAVGVHFSGENARFKIGVTSSGGETGASLGAGWSF